MDNPSSPFVHEQGKPFDDPNCVLSEELINLGTTSTFNQSSGASPGGWNYAPLPGYLPNTANSNSYASFLLSLIGLNFGKPPNVPGWGQIP